MYGDAALRSINNRDCIMGFFTTSRFEKFVNDNSAALAQHVYYNSAKAAQDIMAALDGQLPAKANIDAIAMLLSAVRSSVELTAVDRQFGPKAAGALQRALKSTYESMPEDPSRPAFEDVLSLTNGVLRDTSEVTDAMRAFAAAAFDSRDPEDELFNQSLAYGLTVGGTIVDIVSSNA